VLGFVLFGAVVVLLGWAIVDSFIRYGLFTGLIMTGGAVAAFLIPFAAWIVIAGYLLYRLNTPPRPRKSRIRDRGRGPVPGRRASRDRCPDVRATAVDAADRDARLEQLLESGALAEALRYAKEKAARALDAGDHRLARIYEQYLERIRRRGR
jgi:hypothetical protein